MPQEYKMSDRKPVRYNRLSEARGAVIKFLKANPLSTSEEIYEACGVGVLSVVKKGIFKNCMYNGKRCWRVVANPERFI